MLTSLSDEVEQAALLGGLTVVNRPDLPLEPMSFGFVMGDGSVDVAT